MAANEINSSLPLSAGAQQSNDQYMPSPCFYSKSGAKTTQGQLLVPYIIHQLNNINTYVDISPGQRPETRICGNPILVNAKQYKRIMRRREARNKLEKRMKPMDTGKEYLHESRHKHACRRPRGPGGRFLTKNDLENLATQSENLSIPNEHIVNCDVQNKIAS